MGSQESKIEQEFRKEESVPRDNSTLNNSVPSTPILTPVDPRSPSANIARTPLEVILGHTMLDEQDVCNEMKPAEDKSLVNVVLGIDPRSPTVEFNRTPIVIGSVSKENVRKLKNKNLDNVLKSEIHTTPTPTSKRSNSVPPKLLEVSPVSIVSGYKRKSFVGLLETNIDYTETDLDTIANKSLPLEVDELVPCNNLKHQMEALKLESTVEKFTLKEEKEVELIPEPVINVTAQVKDFDKKLSNLIYKDVSDNGENEGNVKLTKPKENNRTPLGVRNSNDDSRKSTNKLRVSDKPRKCEFSKIPIFKEHYKKSTVQCENTPPAKYEEPTKKVRATQWDTDKSLII